MARNCKLLDTTWINGKLSKSTISEKRRNYQVTTVSVKSYIAAAADDNDPDREFFLDVDS